MPNWCAAAQTKLDRASRPLRPTQAGQRRLDRAGRILPRVESTLRGLEGLAAPV